MGIFGWSLPPGCGTLPDEEPEQLNNQYFAEAFPDYSGPGELYRALYKYTACGPSLGVTISFIEELPPDGFSDFGGEREAYRTLYCDDLYKLGTWADMDARGELITAFQIGSIVEGVDYDCQTIELDADQLDEEPGEFHDRFMKAVDDVNDEANSIWMDTHACDTCMAHWAEEGITEFELGDPVWLDCPDCNGDGVPR